MNIMDETEWRLCPVCGSKTRDRIREDTVLINHHLYCQKCKQETLINVQQLNMSAISKCTILKFICAHLCVPVFVCKI